MSVRQLVPQEAFERWVVEPTPATRSGLWHAIRRSGVELERRETITWAIDNLDLTALRGDRGDFLVVMMRAALQDILRPRYGMQSITEEHGDDVDAFNHHAYEYYRQENSSIRTGVHEGLVDLDALISKAGSAPSQGIGNESRQRSNPSTDGHET